MLNQLKLKLTPTSPPKLEDAYIGEMWGIIQLFYTDFDKNETHELFNWEWNLQWFVKWFFENKDAMKHFELISPHGSLNEKKMTKPEEFWRLRDKEYSNEAEDYIWHCYLDDFAATHDLHQGLLASGSPSVLICRNRTIGEAGIIGEVGILQDDGVMDVYKFDLEEFLNEGVEEIRLFNQAYEDREFRLTRQFLDECVLRGVNGQELLFTIDRAIILYGKFRRMNILIEGINTWQQYQLENQEELIAQTVEGNFYLSSESSSVSFLMRSQKEIFAYLENLKNEDYQGLISFIFYKHEIRNYIRWAVRKSKEL